MKSKILLVDDDFQNRQLLQTHLQEAGYQVVSAPNGKVAHSLITIYNDFAACISDIRLPEIDGLTLLRFIMKTQPMPVILLSSSFEIQEQKEAAEFGAAFMLRKPANREEILTGLKDCLRAQELLSSEKNPGKTTANAQRPAHSKTAAPSAEKPEDEEKLDFSEVNAGSTAKIIVVEKGLPPSSTAAHFRSPSFSHSIDDSIDTADLKPRPHTDEPSPKEEEISRDDEFCRINIHDFISAEELQCDIFIRLKAEKYIKVAHQGNAFTQESLNTYKARKIEYLYMFREDFKKYVGFSVSLSDRVTSSPTLPKAKKIQFIKHASEMIATQLHFNGVDEASFDNAKTIMDSTLSVMSDSEELVSMIDMLNAASDTTYAHSIGVGLYSAMLAKAVGGGMGSPLVLFKVCMGGMVHDIGKKELPPEILNRPRRLLTAQEIQIYESHTIRGAQILSKLPFVQNDIIKIVAQHHENCLGLGYPANLRSEFIHPLARLVSVANEFCSLAIRGIDTPPLSPAEAIERMAVVFQDTLDPVFFVALAKLFNIQLDPSYHDAQRRNRLTAQEATIALPRETAPKTPHSGT